MSDSRWLVDAAFRGLRLDKFLAAPDRLGSRSRAVAALERGKIFVNDEEATPRDAARPLETGDCVRLWQDRPGSARAKGRRSARRGELSIVYEDDALIVIDKPPGLLTVPLERREDETSVQDELVLYLRSKGKRKPLVIHRIDRDTSGLVAFAKRPDVYERLRGQFRRHEPDRIYLAVVYGHPSPESGRWDDHLVWDQRALIQKVTHPKDPQGQKATCYYRVVEPLHGASLIEVKLQTGRRNQIRLQARVRGHTLVGEQRYTYGDSNDRQIPFSRQALHAFRLALDHPETGERLSFEAPLPGDMAELIEELR